MQIQCKFSQESKNKFMRMLQDKLEISAVRGWETAVERTPANGETPYSTGRLRQSLRFQKTGELEYSIIAQVPYSVFLEFGTGVRGRMTGGMPEFENDPQPYMSYHNGEVLVTRQNGMLLDKPYIRHTLGMDAQPYMRPALITAYNELKRLLNN